MGTDTSAPTEPTGEPIGAPTASSPHSPSPRRSLVVKLKCNVPERLRHAETYPTPQSLDSAFPHDSTDMAPVKDPNSVDGLSAKLRECVGMLSVC